MTARRARVSVMRLSIVNPVTSKKSQQLGGQRGHTETQRLLLGNRGGGAVLLTSEKRQQQGGHGLQNTVSRPERVRTGKNKTRHGQTGNERTGQDRTRHASCPEFFSNDWFGVCN